MKTRRIFAAVSSRRLVVGVLFIGTLNVLLILHIITKFRQDDSTQLIDLKDFTFLKEHRSCSELENRPIILVAIYSAPKNFDERKAIRETWGYKDPRSLVIFLLGATNSEDLRNRIDIENDFYNDIVQGNFIDSYRNLTYKHIMTFKWFLYNCPDVPFLLRVDDDVFINTPRLYKFLQSSRIQSEQLIFCGINYAMEVIRNESSLWFVSTDEYKESMYPEYCKGYQVLYSSEIVRLLYEKAQTLPYFWVEDVHVTGTTRSKLNISLTSNYQHFRPLEPILERKAGRFIFTDPNLEEWEIRQLWEII